jgi:hypothetical protein
VSLYGRLIRLTSAVTVALGVAILIVTAIHGGGITGFLIGALFVAAGAGRITMLRRSGR